MTAAQDRRPPRDTVDHLVRRDPAVGTPFALWNTSPVVLSVIGRDHTGFYLDAGAKLGAQLEFAGLFPEALLIPGPWPDFGAAAEPSMWGCEVAWHEGDPPSIRTRYPGAAAALAARPRDPASAGLAGEVLRQYEAMWRAIDPGLVERYGWLDGLGYALGPLDTAAELLGHTTLFLELYDHPRDVHALLDAITDSLVGFLRAQERINGRLRLLVIPDHLCGQLSPEHVEEFGLPYLSRIFGAFPDAIGLYHNEGEMLHALESVPRMGARIFHFGTDLAETKRRIGDEIVLMGNLDPLAELLSGTPEDVARVARDRLAVGATGGGFMLSSAGGMAPGTPPENIRAAVAATVG